MLTGIKNIFWDLDHTLWDFDKNSDLTFKKILKLNQINIDYKIFLKAYHPINRKYWDMYRQNKVSKPDLRFFRLYDTFKKINYNITDNLINKMAEDYIFHLSDYNYLIPNAVLVLEKFSMKYDMHIITNGFKNVQLKKLKKSGLKKYFKTLTISEDIGVQKPNEKIFFHALSNASAEIKNSIMIGDNYNADVLGAKNIGMKSIYFNFHKKNSINSKEIIVIDDLIELIKFL